MSSPPKLLDRRSDDRRRALGRRHVGDDADGASRPGMRRDRGVELVGPARAEDDVRALLREPGRDPAADATARAGDDRDLAGEPEIHPSILDPYVPGMPPPVCSRPARSSSQTTNALPGLEPELADDRAGDGREHARDDIGRRAPRRR